MGLTREDVPSSPLTSSSSTSFDSERDSIETQRPARPIRSSHDYDTEEDDSEDLIYATSDSRRPSGHKSSPSTSRLLDATGGDGGEPASPQDERKQQELRRAYELGDEGEGSYGAASRPRDLLQAIKGFFARNNGFLLIASSQFFFASISTCVKLLQERVEMPVWEIILVRMSATWLGCYLYMRWTDVEHPLLGPPGVRLLLAARGFVGFFGLFPGYYALRYISLSDATVLSFLAPVLVGILAFFLLKEPYSRTEGLAALFSLFGTILIAKPTFLFPPSITDPVEPGKDVVTPQERTRAVFIALGGTLGAAGAYVIIRKIGKRANALHSISYFSIWCCIVSSLYPFVFNAPPVFEFTRSFFALIIPIGVFGFCAQALLTLGLQREKAGRGTLAVYSNLLFAMILERLVFNKYPDLLSLLGAAIIVGGAVKVALEKSKMTDAQVLKSEEAKLEEGELLRRLSEDDVEEPLGLGRGMAGSR
ncbi:hypothetical protein BCR35DRAFT_304458 [Leucosporidium creatinivorum]|uniref:EamA domain-containing protein n=1 Tax=Leucosporidium creatinivorum TaxID=106004 RepID=A0A1Y2F8R6_9BASI|nr:hypothetical protein BCR35DRAFT_304458 [Leucosporidium creatinivorum]